MSTDFERIRAYYATFDEWGRLDQPNGALELRRTLELLEQHLPAHSRVLDLGGGPGRYAVELAQRGHRVTLADLSPMNLEAARSRFSEHEVSERIEGVDEVNAVDLARYADQHFDAVLALGPFYHLLHEDERRRAIEELRRVIKPGGLVFVAYIPRLSGIAGLLERAALRPNQVSAECFAEAAASGIFRNPAGEGFQEGYYPAVGELEALLQATELSIVDRVSLKSLLHGRGELVARLGSALRTAVEQAADALCRDPAVVDSCGHVLIIARRLSP